MGAENRIVRRSFPCGVGQAGLAGAVHTEGVSVLTSNTEYRLHGAGDGRISATLARALQVSSSYSASS